MGHGDEVYIDASFNLHYPEGELTLANLIEKNIKNNQGVGEGPKGFQRPEITMGYCLCKPYERIEITTWFHTLSNRLLREYVFEESRSRIRLPKEVFES